MTPLLDVLLTATVLVAGITVILYALRFFPVVKSPSAQFELDLVPPRSMAHEIDRSTHMVRTEAKRIKSQPKLKG